MALTRSSNKELLELPDCVGLLENGRCKWHNLSSCIGAKCKYYRASSSVQQIRERLCSLDEQKQEHIAQKYYGGFRPWRNK